MRKRRIPVAFLFLFRRSAAGSVPGVLPCAIETAAGGAVRDYKIGVLSRPWQIIKKRVCQGRLLAGDPGNSQKSTFARGRFGRSTLAIHEKARLPGAVCGRRPWHIKNVLCSIRYRPLPPPTDSAKHRQQLYFDRAANSNPSGAPSKKRAKRRRANCLSKTSFTPCFQCS